MRGRMWLGVSIAAWLGLAAGPVSAQAWRFEAKRDPFTDGIVSRAHATNRAQSLNVRCQDDRLEAYFWAPGYLGDGTSVRYRFDSGEVRTNTWDVSTDGAGAFVPGPGEFARLLMTSSVLHIEVEGEYGAAERYRFSLAGSSGPIGRVLDACGVPRQEIYEPGGPIWRRAVEAIDAAPRSEVEALSSVLEAAGLYEGPVGRTRPRALYQALSDFYAGYWSLCEEGQTLTASCSTWLSRRRFDPDADYPTEPIELLIEAMSARTEDAPATGTDAGRPISWSRAPHAEYPATALGSAVTAAAVELRCTPQPNGSLTQCSIVSEEPSGHGFGQAALAGARRARLSPTYVSEVGTDPIEFTIRFRLPE